MKFQKILSLLMIQILCVAKCAIVHTKYGVLNGTTDINREGKQFLSFYGIPYAAPPVGKLRLKSPTEPNSWTGVREAHQRPPSCVQSVTSPITNSSELKGQEDCLYLNVFTHSLPNERNEKLPVVVFIHGGAFQHGNSYKHEPKFFMDKQIVFVSLNYRLGPLGFLGMGEKEFSGNFGLKDQAMALRWVRDNIAAFNGDSLNITLFGGSAGAASVHLQMFNPYSVGMFSTGTFHKAIMHSGNAFSSWAVNTRQIGRMMTAAFAVSAHCYNNNTRRMLDCLQQLSVIDFPNIENKMTYFGSVSMPAPFFQPIVEGKDVEDAAILTMPRDDNYQTKNIPWIVGLNTAEGTVTATTCINNDGRLVKLLNENPDRFMPMFTHLTYISNVDDFSNLTQQIKKYYFGNREMGVETAKELVELLGDAFFTFSTVNSILTNHAPTYVYLYDYKSVLRSTWAFDDRGNDMGVSHADEMYSFFYYEGKSEKMSSNDTVISNKLIDLWSNFVINGNPNAMEKTEHVLWTPKESDEIEYLYIGPDEFKMKKGFYQDRYQFWRALPTGLFQRQIEVK